METLFNVGECVDKIRGAAKALNDQCQFGDSIFSTEMTQARHALLALMNELQVLLCQPTDYLRHLATQIQVLACLQWLGDFQVLASIPLNSSARIQDISEVVSVPEAQLTRILRMIITAGFLHEPKPGYVAHTALSAGFVTRPSHLDAALFLAETAAPAALNMATATKLYGQSNDPNECAYSLASNTAQSFQSSCNMCPKLQQKFSAYTRHLDATDDGAAVELLSRLDWQKLGNARVADVSADSVSSALALAKLYPCLSFVVQMSDTASDSIGPSINGQFVERVSVQQRVGGQQQVVRDAAVYMVRMTSSVLAASFAQLCTQILAELQAHVEVLSANPTATLILQVRVLPKTTIDDPCIKETAHVLDLSLLQLGKERPVEITDLFALVESVRSNGSGRLVVVKKMLSQSGAFVVLGVKYQE